MRHPHKAAVRPLWQYPCSTPPPAPCFPSLKGSSSSSRLPGTGTGHGGGTPGPATRSGASTPAAPWERDDAAPGTRGGLRSSASSVALGSRGGGGSSGGGIALGATGASRVTEVMRVYTPVPRSAAAGGTPASRAGGRAASAADEVRAVRDLPDAPGTGLSRAGSASLKL